MPVQAPKSPEQKSYEQKLEEVEGEISRLYVQYKLEDEENFPTAVSFFKPKRGEPTKSIRFYEAQQLKIDRDEKEYLVTKDQTTT